MGLEEGEGPDHPFVRLKNHLGILTCELCNAIPKFPFNPSVSQILCPSQDCVCLRGKLSISTD